jgi:hypothetical protein
VIRRSTSWASARVAGWDGSAAKAIVNRPFAWSIVAKVWPPACRAAPACVNGAPARSRPHRSWAVAPDVRAMVKRAPA